ncbi:MAG: NADH-quinone oxidoreductase subunit J [Desulfobacula sp.]|nr:NADH-quinone oxidoreductase subunit J [Desulfobacula sp.]
MIAYYQIIAQIMFVASILLTITGALLAVNAKILMHSVLGLAVCLLGVAGLYFYLGSMFLALMQVMIYVGAVCIVLVFGIMVGHTPNESAKKNDIGRNTLLGLVASGIAGLGLVITIFGRTSWETPAAVGDFSMEWIGENLLLKYCLAFELISVVLLIAIVGSIILAKSGRE